MTLEVPSADFYYAQELLSDKEQELLGTVREFLRTEVAPHANDYWNRAEFPHHLIGKIAKLGIAGLQYDECTDETASNLFWGLLTAEFARVDQSTRVFFGAHADLAMGAINRLGSAAQRRRWLPAMARMERIGCFALTEPGSGSDVAKGLSTTARRDGDSWVLDGVKRWIGNATFADVLVVFARDVADDQVKAFLVEKGMPGLSTAKIENKYALRTVQNGEITLDSCRVPAHNRLQECHSFRDVSDCLRLTRSSVAWDAVGDMSAAYELALERAKNHEQFGRPIAKFQLVQDLLVKMLGNVTAAMSMVVRLAEQQDRGRFLDEQSSLAKIYCAARLREVVSWARELFGAEGIVLDNDIMRFFADAEAIYSYEGTHQINTLIVGRAVTGVGAFG